MASSDEHLLLYNRSRELVCYPVLKSNIMLVNLLLYEAGAHTFAMDYTAQISYRLLKNSHYCHCDTKLRFEANCKSFSSQSQSSNISLCLLR